MTAVTPPTPGLIRLTWLARRVSPSFLPASCVCVPPKTGPSVEEDKHPRQENRFLVKDVLVAVLPC